MADGNKRYYWLKFQKDFFSSLRIKRLRKLAGGDTFTIIYLKLQLLSLKDEGMLKYKGIFETFEEEMAEEIDEEIDNVKITIQYLLSCGLMEQTDDEYFLPYVEQNIGSETATAQRVRASRERKKLLHCNTDVTEVKQSCYTEKEKEKEKEKESETEEEKKKSRKAPRVCFPLDDRLNSAFEEFVKMRRQIKAPMTDRAIDLAIKKLETLADNDNDTMIAILEQSVMNSWKGLFPLKTEMQSNKKGGIDWDEVYKTFGVEE